MSEAKRRNLLVPAMFTNAVSRKQIPRFIRNDDGLEDCKN